MLSRLISNSLSPPSVVSEAAVIVSIPLTIGASNKSVVAVTVNSS